VKAGIEKSQVKLRLHGELANEITDTKQTIQELKSIREEY